MRDVVLFGDCIEQLRKIPEGSVQTCVTSPPYYGLRDYLGARKWMGGDPACDHDQAIEHGPHHPGQVEQTKWKKAEAAGKGQTALTYSCSKCDAWYGQIGQEPHHVLYIEHMVEVFREVWRTLRSDGTLWLNIGDAYANDSKWGGTTSGKHTKDLHGKTAVGRSKKQTGLKPKDLMMVPARLAIALQEEGWTLRSDVVWHKPNVMPESVQDRPTNAYEHVFLLTKGPEYFYDADAIREPFTGENDHDRTGGSYAPPGQSPHTGSREGLAYNPLGRNKRNVWSINTRPYKGAHFAVMPPELAETCIKAGSKPGDLVLDPFAGSGTTLAAAKGLRRDYVGIEINEDYRPLIEERTGVASKDASLRSAFEDMQELE